MERHSTADGSAEGTVGGDATGPGRPHRRDTSRRAPRRFFAAESLRLAEFELGAEVELMEGEAEHAARVLRMEPGAAAVALDGRGGQIPLCVARADRRRASFEASGAPRFEPAPGSSESPEPRIELALAWPKHPRGEAMLDRLVQLGVASLTPLTTARTGSEKRLGPRARAQRVMREALKQSGGAWLPRLEDAESLESWLARATADDAAAGPLFWLDPRADATLASALSQGAGGWRAARAVIGPEGGFEASEVEALEAAGAIGVRLTTRVLRIETAAEASAALIGSILGRVDPSG